MKINILKVTLFHKDYRTMDLHGSLSTLMRIIDKIATICPDILYPFCIILLVYNSVDNF